MNDLCADIGYSSVTHYGEQLCGDHIDVVEKEADDSTIIVLTDGLGSGVKASILSTLTSKIISTMIAAGLPLSECIKTIAATLPVCSVRKVAYSTFTIIHLINNEIVEIIQYDNPRVILIRNNKNIEYPTVELNIDGKKIYRTTMRLQEGDIFVAMSDGCPHAGIGTSLSFGWHRDKIAEFMEDASDKGYTAKGLSTLLIDECNKLYGGKPGDDATACVVRIRKRVPMNLMFGPPANRDDDEQVLSTFFSKPGKRIVCGGTTSSIVARYLNTPIKTELKFEVPDIPPISYIEGVDLVTEGVITINKVLFYAYDYLENNENYEHWSLKHDGASMIARLLFEEATDINFFVGRAINPAHQNPDLPINFSIKMNLVKELSECLKKMGKHIKVTYY